MKYKLLLLFLVLLMICGCTNRECIRSHEEKKQCVYYSYIYSGKVLIAIPHYYDCIKTICDEWEKIEE